MTALPFLIAWGLVKLRPIHTFEGSARVFLGIAMHSED